MTLERIAADLARETSGLRFGPPVAHVYHPLEYAWEPHRRYLRRYGAPPRPIVMLGMNPGPWGMAQTGVPFGEVTAVRDWMGIEAAVAAVAPQTAGPGVCLHPPGGQRAAAVGLGPEKLRLRRSFFPGFFRGQLLPLDVHGRWRPKSDA